MSNLETIQRFEELEAGRIIGDLDETERAELLELSKIHEYEDDLSLEMTFSALETYHLDSREMHLPDTLLSSLNESKTPFVNSQSSADQSVSSTKQNDIDKTHWKQIILAPQTAWAVAALFAILFLIKSSLPTKNSNSILEKLITVVPLSSIEARDKLIADTNNLLELNFEGMKSYEGMKGAVIWSDDKQEGYMTFTGLSINDPEQNQYQLWIIDPTRDEMPVDGGVFDIAKELQTVVIPIRNALIISDPKAFVITLEQPGGVVVSKQENVVAIAQL